MFYRDLYSEKARGRCFEGGGGGEGQGTVTFVTSGNAAEAVGKISEQGEIQSLCPPPTLPRFVANRNHRISSESPMGPVNTTYSREDENMTRNLFNGRSTGTLLYRSTDNRLNILNPVVLPCKQVS